MKLFHGSSVGNIHTLEPRLADHERPYIYLSENDVVASFYIVNAVERPYYWFPYGFSRNKIPIYHELYPNALREVAEGHTGFLYQVDAGQNQVTPFLDIPGAWLGTEAISVIRSIFISNAYDYFLDLESQNRLIIWRFDHWAPEQLTQWYDKIVDYLEKKNMIATPGCSYAMFIKDKLPQVWGNYENRCKSHL